MVEARSRLQTLELWALGDSNARPPPCEGAPAERCARLRSAGQSRAKRVQLGVRLVRHHLGVDRPPRAAGRQPFNADGRSALLSRVRLLIPERAAPLPKGMWRDSNGHGSTSADGRASGKKDRDRPADMVTRTT